MAPQPEQGVEIPPVPQRLDIAISDFGEVAQLPVHVRERWAASLDETHSSKVVEKEVALEQIKERLHKADQKREEFQKWLGGKAKSVGKHYPKPEGVNRKRTRLEERLAAAERTRQSLLQAVRVRAATLGDHKSRERAAEDEDRSQLLASKLYAELQAAEERRLALQDAKRERLTAARAAASHKVAKVQEEHERTRSEQRRKIGERLQQAQQLRDERVSARIERAAAGFRRARDIGSQVRSQEEQEGERKASAIRARLDAAAKRRLRRLQRAASAASVPLPEAPEDPSAADNEQSAAVLDRLRRQTQARRLQSCWRAFVKRRRTTASLAEAFIATGITGMADAEMEDADEEAELAPGNVVFIGGVSGGRSSRHAAFEKFSNTLQAPATLKAAQSLLRRLEARLRSKGSVDASCAVLLRRLFPRAPKNASPQERYPARVFLCAFMICTHPEVVFNNTGERERSLAAAAAEMVAAFEALLARIVAPLPPTATGSPQTLSPTTTMDRAPSAPMDIPRAASPEEDGSSAEASPVAMKASLAIPPSPLKAGMLALREAAEGKAPSSTSDAGSHTLSHTAVAASSLAEHLLAFDATWIMYLELFAAWKLEDASNLEGDLVAMAVALEMSLLRKIGPAGRDSPRVRGSHDLQAMLTQVAHDHQLLRERVAKLSGGAGLERLDAALSQARETVAAESGADSSGWESDRSGLRSRRSFTSAQSPQAPGTPRSPQPPPAAAAGLESVDDGAAGGRGNEALAWQLLYNPAYRLPAADAEAAWQRAVVAAGGSPAEAPEESAAPEAVPLQQLGSYLKQQAQTIAERAFWDGVTSRLQAGVAGTRDAGVVLASLLAELAAELAAAIPDGERAGQLRARFAQAALEQRLAAGADGLDLQAALGDLEELSRTLLALGSVAREEEAQASQLKTREVLLGALQMAPGEERAAAVARGLAAALRLMHAQLKLLKADSANAHLALMASKLHSHGVTAYLQTKFAAAYQLPQDDALTSEALAARLPRTSEWAARTAATLPAMLAQLSGAGLPLTPTAHSAAQVLPTQLRAGLRSPRAETTGGASTEALKPSYPVSASSWQGSLRLGLLSLMCSDAPAAGPGLAETLRFDAERLHAAQDRLQQLLVITASLLIVQQMRQARSLPPLTAEERASALRRITLVLSDPAMKLTELVGLLAALVDTEPTSPLEEQLRSAFLRIVNPTSDAFRSLRMNVGMAVAAYMLHGPEAVAQVPEAGAAVRTVLARAGAAAMSSEVEALAEELALVAAAGEAVHGRVYQALLPSA